VCIWSCMLMQDIALFDIHEQLFRLYVWSSKLYEHLSVSSSDLVFSWLRMDLDGIILNLTHFRIVACDNQHIRLYHFIMRNNNVNVMTHDPEPFFALQKCDNLQKNFYHSDTHSILFTIILTIFILITPLILNEWASRKAILTKESIEVLTVR